MPELFCNQSQKQASNKQQEHEISNELTNEADQLTDDVPSDSNPYSLNDHKSYALRMQINMSV